MKFLKNSFELYQFIYKSVPASGTSERANGRGATAIFRPLGALSLRSSCCAPFLCSLVL